jgi:hypothetical protein
MVEMRRKDFGAQRTSRDCFRSTGLVRDGNQVRLGVTRYPMACLYTSGSVLTIAREGNESLYH